jgi:hypothetical protein
MLPSEARLESVVAENEHILQLLFQTDPQTVTQEGDQDVGLDTSLDLVKDGSQVQLGFESAEHNAILPAIIASEKRLGRYIRHLFCCVTSSKSTNPKLLCTFRVKLRKMS